MKLCNHCGKPSDKPCTSVYVEVAEGGPWLTEELTVTSEWDARGLWPNEEAAERAIEQWLTMSKKP